MKLNKFFLFISFFYFFGYNAQEIISTQGDYFTNGTGSLSWTIGEPITETYSSASNDLSQGFQQTELQATLVEEAIIDITVQIYPNPVSDFLNISIDQQKINHSFLIFDAQGKLLKNEVILSSSSIIDFSLYTKGIYFLKIQNKDKQLIKTYKIVKQ